MAMRPEADQREIDASGLGTTTNRIIEKYGLPIPETLDGLAFGRTPVRTPAPSVAPAPTAGASAAP
jgi:hypothetical protein